jgi:SAM-dependent methyltransferase
MAANSTASHWDDTYAAGETTRSWFQEYPGVSLTMFDAAAITPDATVIDVGGGASPLAGALLERGFRDVTVLDVSAAGMAYARERLGARAEQVRWLVADVRVWEPQRRYRVWHDRAVFHFLVSAEDRRQYVRALDTATEPGSVAVFGLFAPDGPQQCSGLPVARYSAPGLTGELGPEWALIAQDREEHHTPAGAIQPFTWAALRKQPRLGFYRSADRIVQRSIGPVSARRPGAPLASLATGADRDRPRH